jgi:membrane-bound inhibitor of C-type lysozyme
MRKWKRRRKPFSGSLDAAFRSPRSIHLAPARLFHITAPGLDLRDEYRLGADMNGYKTAIVGAAFCVAGILTGPASALAQTFESYHCADGTRFLVGFFKYDSRAHLQIDGKAVTLRRRLALSGSRYSGGGVTLVIRKAGTTVRHARRPLTACELA